jgi:hypothetical protein
MLLEPAAAEFADHHNARDDGLERCSDEFVLRQAMALDGLNFYGSSPASVGLEVASIAVSPA